MFFDRGENLKFVKKSPMNDLKVLAPGIIIMLALNMTLKSQSTESEVNKEFYKADPYISIILNYLPDSWALTVTESEFIFESRDTVWVLMENRINAPFEDREQLKKRIKEHGIQTWPRVVIDYETKWTLEQTQRAMIQNTWIDEQLAGLPEKMKIAHLYDPLLSRKTGPVYTPKTDKDRELILKYEEEKQKLEQSRIRLPDFSTQVYSLFIREIRGAGDDMHHVYPDKPSHELYTILSTFREVCGK